MTWQNLVDAVEAVAAAVEDDAAWQNVVDARARLKSLLQAVRVACSALSALSSDHDDLRFDGPG